MAAGDRPPPVAAAVGDRPVAAVVEGRRRPRRWGGAGDSGEALATAWRGGAGDGVEGRRRPRRWGGAGDGVERAGAGAGTGRRGRKCGGRRGGAGAGDGGAAAGMRGRVRCVCVCARFEEETTKC